MQARACPDGVKNASPIAEWSRMGSGNRPTAEFPCETVRLVPTSGRTLRTGALSADAHAVAAP